MTSCLDCEVKSRKLPAGRQRSAVQRGFALAAAAALVLRLAIGAVIPTGPAMSADSDGWLFVQQICTSNGLIARTADQSDKDGPASKFDPVHCPLCRVGCASGVLPDPDVTELSPYAFPVRNGQTSDDGVLISAVLSQGFRSRAPPTNSIL